MKKKIFNRRKNNFFNLNFYYLIIFIVFLSIIVIFFSNSKFFINNSTFIIQEYSDKLNYNFINIKINDLKHIDTNEIHAYFEKYKNKSIFLVPIQEIIDNLDNINWIDNVTIKSNYKNSIIINIKEEIPIGIFDNGSQKILFSKNLKILELINEDHLDQELIIFYGRMDLKESTSLISKLDIEILNLVESATFIKKRRWNLKLKNNIIIKLPEENIKQFNIDFKKIYNKLIMTDFKNIEVIDLRIDKKAIIKYKNLIND